MGIYSAPSLTKPPMYFTHLSAIPVSFHYIAGQVVVWQPQSSELAKDMKIKANQAPEKSEGVQLKTQSDSSEDLSGGKAGAFVSDGAEGSEDF